tara:strand:+ start:288 stop:455 length:168 start_codon:yes stop_codon:yes gene_type:complete
MDATQISKSEEFAMAFYGSIGLSEALKAAKTEVEKAIVLEAIATALLTYPKPAVA